MESEIQEKTYFDVLRTDLLRAWLGPDKSYLRKYSPILHSVLPRRRSHVPLRRSGLLLNVLMQRGCRRDLPGGLSGILKGERGIEIGNSLATEMLKHTKCSTHLITRIVKPKASLF